MSDVHFNDCVSCFQWDPILPVKEIIQPIKITPTGGQAQQVGDALVYDNTTGTEQSISFEVKRTLSQTLTVSTSETHVRGITRGLNISAGIEEIGLGLEYTLELSFEYTKENRTEASNTDSIEVTINHPVKAPPGGITEAKLEVSLSKIPETFYTTTATRWYDQELSGSVGDTSSQGGGKYKREEQIVVQVAGGLVSSKNVVTKFKPHQS